MRQRPPRKAGQSADRRGRDYSRCRPNTGFTCGAVRASATTKRRLQACPGGAESAVRCNPLLGVTKSTGWLGLRYWKAVRSEGPQPECYSTLVPVKHGPVLAEPFVMTVCNSEAVAVVAVMRRGADGLTCLRMDRG